MREVTDTTQSDTDMANLNFREVRGLPDIDTIARLADEIWRDHYMPIIGQEQVEYMLANFQNAATIGRQIDAGYRYYLLSRQEVPLAYFALLADTCEPSLHISKLYVLPAWQRKGLGTRIIAFIEQDSRRQGFKRIWLTVNRHNQQAISFYLRNQFVNSGTLIQDIGDGFVMDDFKMVKDLV